MRKNQVSRLKLEAHILGIIGYLAAITFDFSLTPKRGLFAISRQKEFIHAFI